MTARSRPTAVLIAALVVLSTVVGGVAVVSAQDDTSNATSASGPDIDLPPADDVYVKDNGDIVYVDNTSLKKGRQSLGVDISKGLFHTLVAGNSSKFSNVTFNATAILTGDKFATNGTLSVPRPENEILSDFSMNVTAKRTDENATFDATVEASATELASVGRLVKQAHVSGNITTTASRFEVVADAHAQLAFPLGPPQHREFHIMERNGTYILKASQNYTVSPFAAQQWSTRRQAKQTLRQRYVSIAESLGGSADLKIESYSFTQQRSGARLDIEYTVTYRGVERVLINQLTTRLMTNERVAINQSEADAIAERLKNLTVKEVSVRYDQGTRSIDASLHVDLRNYYGVLYAYLNVAESIDMDRSSAASCFNTTAQINRLHKTVEARQAANLTIRHTFAANFSTKSDGSVTFEAEIHTRTKHWAQYVKELKDRGIQTANVHYEIHAAIQNGRINVTVAAEVTGEGLLKRASSRLLTLTNGDDSACGDVKTVRKYIKAFQKSGFQKARVDISIHEGRLRLEAGAAFKNMSALRDALAITDQGAIQSAISRTENDTLTNYVRIEGAVPDNATKSDVRDLPYVNSDTTIHMPDSWDKKFPTMNTSQAKSYLELSGSSSGLGPGFGIAVAVVALLAAALVAVRRRRR